MIAKDKDFDRLVAIVQDNIAILKSINNQILEPYTNAQQYLKLLKDASKSVQISADLRHLLDYCVDYLFSAANPAHNSWVSMYFNSIKLSPVSDSKTKSIKVLNTFGKSSSSSNHHQVDAFCRLVDKYGFDCKQISTSELEATKLNSTNFHCDLLFICGHFTNNTLQVVFSDKTQFVKAKQLALWIDFKRSNISRATLLFCSSDLFAKYFDKSHPEIDFNAFNTNWNVPKQLIYGSALLSAILHYPKAHVHKIAKLVSLLNVYQFDYDIFNNLTPDSYQELYLFPEEFLRTEYNLNKLEIEIYSPASIH